MRKLTATFCLTFAVLLGSVGVSTSNEFIKCLKSYLCEDPQRAAIFVERLAEQGDVSAQKALGDAYFTGKITFTSQIHQDYKRAVKWYRRAAEQGNADAQHSLGLMIDDGHGTIKDAVIGYMWVNIAAANGNEHAIYNRPHMEGRLTPYQIDKANTLARECMRKNYKNCY